MKTEYPWWNFLVDLDSQLTQRLRIAEKPGLLRSAAVFLAHSGDSWFWIAGLVLVWLLGDLFWRARAVFYLICIILLAVLVLLVKFSVRRRRPEGDWGGIYRNTDPHSFPSGHAARAAMLAVLAIGLGPAWFGVALAAWAPLVSLARVAMGVHYLSDVLAGVLLGILAGVLALILH
jgi:undecaprenyl-diphosphatase